MNNNYIYQSFTKALCSECGRAVDGKIIYNDSGVYVLKNCPEHGIHREILEENYGYHLTKGRFEKPGTQSVTQTRAKDGCPHDCGLCDSHDQHTCLGLIEITSRCNMACPMCFAIDNTGPIDLDKLIPFVHEVDLDLQTIGQMMDFYMSAEGGRAEVLQISGGEPTLHPQCIEIIAMARAKGFKYVMLNTNGIRLAEDREFVRALSTFKGGFEVYLQFDGLDDDVYRQLRRRALAETKLRALKNLNRYKIPTTLVATIEAGVNDHLCGEILVYGMSQSCVRGVNFQPVSYYHNLVPAGRRVTLSGILDRIEQQTNNMIQAGDFIPLPCDVERVAITFLLKEHDAFVPITRGHDLSQFKDMIGNTFMFTVEDTLKNISQASDIFDDPACCEFIENLKRFLPASLALRPKAERMRFVDENTFRISVSSFLDRYNFDAKSMQKECAHIITPDLKRIPFSAYNMLYR